MNRGVVIAVTIFDCVKKGYNLINKKSQKISFNLIFIFE